MHSEIEYLALCDKILMEGDLFNDRTGVGTLGIFGAQMRFDLRESFPLLTTKRVFWRGVVEELLWFLKGSTNVQDLDPSVQKWWTPWARADGSLGPIYGEQYRKARWWFEVEPRVFEAPNIELTEGLVAGVGIVPDNFYWHQPELVVKLKQIWRDMLKRCYDPQSKGFAAYGAKGVHVHESWHNFETFFNDAQKLPDWPLKAVYWDEYTLDKDILFASNRYGPDTCKWASHTEQSLNTSTIKAFSAVSPEGSVEVIPSIGVANRELGLNVSATHRALNGKLNTHHGWSNFEYLSASEGRVIRFIELDQLKRLIAGIITDPHSRRHMINLWNSPAMNQAALPCCHGATIQFHVSASGELSCHMYQRSADMLLGVPVNIASYALLTHIIAHYTDLEVGDFIWTGGDCHIYRNHVEQVQEQLARVPKLSPTIQLNIPEGCSIDQLEFEHFTLNNYNPHPPIKGDVAV